MKHKASRMAAALEFLTWYKWEGESLINRVIMGDETWEHTYRAHPSQNAENSVKVRGKTTSKKIQGIKSKRLGLSKGVNVFAYSAVQ